MGLFGKKKSVDKTINDSLASAKTTEQLRLNISNVEVLTNDELAARSFSLNSCLTFFSTYFSSYKTELLTGRPNFLQSWPELLSSYVTVLKLDGVVFLINTNDGLFVVRERNLSKQSISFINQTVEDIKNIKYTAIVEIAGYNLSFTDINYQTIQSVYDIGTSFLRTIHVSSSFYSTAIRRIDSLEELLTCEVTLIEGYKNIIGLTGGLWISPKQGKDTPSMSALTKIEDAMKNIVGMTNSKQLVKTTSTPIDVTAPIVDFSKFMPDKMLDRILNVTASKFQIQLELLNGGATFENVAASLEAFKTIVLEGERLKFMSALNNLRYDLKQRI